MRWLALCGCLLVSMPAPAADGGGGFSIEGAGVLTCRTFLNEREQRSNVYYMMGGWLDGYVTAFNEHVADTYDITPFESSELLTEVIYRHCKDHVDDRLYSVMHAITARLSSDRLKSKSATITIRVADREGTMYAEVLRRMQQELKQRGYLRDSSGAFDVQTIGAIRAFQAAVAFEPTGYPDQATLWRLLRSE